ncbi:MULTISPECIES: Fur family transcriptional regulator [Prosthecochloris]|uniref:Transcriptional repressor n=1 Tax=Prosthecochloris vibrioformis TaxID=1098 RepID=A0A5C4RYA7_PROVB|nr:MULTISPECIES: Fur family transcriptional regulator [Prosthecochloris]ANT65431.1 Peroxide-responsive repressor PerR [Prosthecochloris sp. CIB 2401]TNJ35919.1 transcriptional repressor [Prosthecochloris vibrioformis]
MAENSIYSDDHAMQLFIETCRAHGLKVTPQRIAIYRELKASGKHPSADMLYKQLCGAHPTLSFDTVHRTLLTFAEIGVVATVESHSGVRRFDPDISRHHHIHCVQCGAIIDFHDDHLDGIEIPGDVGHGFEIRGKRVVISGICPACKSAE